MSRVLRNINKHVAEAKPSDYENVSYNCYLRTLAEISNEYISEKEELKQAILKIEDEKTRLKLLELL